jgi:glycosyltransferase involved in cell wall biosynthesis
MVMSSVALCLIAKNEAALIGACLDSVVNAVDQVIVVDTGSTDETVAIAQAKGAEIVHFMWCDDFSAARNAALASVRCDWVLVLDCDERLASGAAQKIRSATGKAQAEAYVLPLVNADSMAAHPDDVVSGKNALEAPIWLPRLFRFSSDLIWEGRVHENLSAWMGRRNGRVASIDAPIAHYGCVPDYRENRGNSDRNLKLLLAQLRDQPNDWFSRTFLLEELLVRNDPAIQSHKAYLENQLTVELLPAIAAGRAQTGIVKTLTVCMAVAANHADFQRVCHWVAEARSVGVAHPNIDFMEGLALERLSLSDHGADQEHLVLARDAYLRVLSSEEKVWVDALIGGIRSWNGILRLSTVLLQLGHFEDALEGFRRVSKQNVQAGEKAAMGQAEALIALGRPEEALGLIFPWMEANPQNCDASILAASACEALGDPVAARDFWICAANNARESLNGLHRLHRLNQGLAAMAS